MSEKHSPGPWEIRSWGTGAEESGVFTAPFRHFPDSVPVQGRICILTDGASANARLIALAPRLLSALRHAIECEEHLVERCEECHAARDLIKRLDGE